MPTHSDVHVDRPLSNFAVEYRNKAFIGDMVVPDVPVMNKSDSYFIFTKKDNFTIPEDLRGPKDYANQVDWSTSTSTYYCEDKALRNFLPDSIVNNSDTPIKPRQRTTGNATNLLTLAKEKRCVDAVFGASNYASAYKATLTGNDKWSDYTNSDPIGNVETGKAACFLEPNTMVIGGQVWRKLKHHPQILDRITGGATAGDAAIVRPQLVADIFEVDRLLIGKAKYNSANKGQTASYTYLWGKLCALLYLEEETNLENVSAWKNFRWIQESTEVGYMVRTYREEAKGGGGEWIEVETSYDIVQVCSDVGYLISGAVA